MQSIKSEDKKRIVALVAEISYDICKICGKSKRTAMYRYKPQQYVKDYSPSIIHPVCRKCVYKEVYGNKNYLKNMKERTLDEK